MTWVQYELAIAEPQRVPSVCWSRTMQQAIAASSVSSPLPAGETQRFSVSDPKQGHT
jgi:hypothetical protein